MRWLRSLKNPESGERDPEWSFPIDTEDDQSDQCLDMINGYYVCDSSINLCSITWCDNYYDCADGRDEIPSVCTIWKRKREIYDSKLKKTLNEIFTQNFPP